jgi:hypothetical protein
MTEKISIPRIVNVQLKDWDAYENLSKGQLVALIDTHDKPVPPAKTKQDLIDVARDL